MSDFLKTFKEKSFDDRKTQALDIIKKYPERCPVIVTKDLNCSLPDLSTHKFLVPRDITVSQFIHTIKNRNNLDSTVALFVFINNTIPSTSQRMGNIYKKYKSDDYFLYIQYTSENTFGNY